MTQDRDLERLLDSWLADGPLVVADRVINDTVGRIARQPQRPAWRLRPWRFPTMSSPIRAVVIGGALLAAIGAGAVLTVGTKPPSTPPPSASPAPSPSSGPSPSPVACEDDIPGCAGPLSAGTHLSTNLDPPLTYQVAQGWTNSVDSPTIFKLDPADSTRPYVIVWTNPVIVDQAKDCTITARPDVGGTVADWVRFLTTNEALEASTPEAVDLPRGVSDHKSFATQIDLRIKDSWPSCPNGRGFVFIRNVDPIAGQQDYGLGPDRMRVILVPNGGRTMVVQVYGPSDELSFRGTMSDVMQTIDRFEFRTDLWTPLPSATSGSVTCEDGLPGCQGPLAAGPHGSKQFGPRLIHYETPEGWTNSIDTSTVYKLDGPGGTASILLWSDPSFEDQTPASCEPVGKNKGPSVPTAANWVTYLQTLPGLVTTSAPFDFQGNNDHGTQSMEISLDPAWTETCPGHTDPEVLFIAHTTPPVAAYGVGPNDRLRVIVFDTATYGQHTVVVQVYGPVDDAGFAATMAVAEPVLRSFVFGCGPGAGYGPCGGYASPVP